MTFRVASAPHNPRHLLRCFSPALSFVSLAFLNSLVSANAALLLTIGSFLLTWGTDFYPVRVLGSSARPMMLPKPSPALDKNPVPMGPEILSSAGAGVLRHFQTPVLYWINFSLGLQWSFFYLQLTILAFLLKILSFVLTALASSLTVGAFLLTVGKCV